MKQTLILILLLTLGLALNAQAEALPWSEQAAAGRDAKALESMAHAHLDQETPDPTQAALWLESAAKAGSGSAMAHLAWLHAEGLGVKKDGGQAVYWYEQAVDAGEVQHTLSLGWAYLRGELVPRDRAQSEDWFRKGIEADYPQARIALASVLIADAFGGQAPERALEAEALLQPALEAEPQLVSYFLARLYVEGIGDVERDMTRGFAYTRMAAELGHAQMQGWLGRMYADGDGVEADPAEALKWASLAAAGGDIFGNRIRLELEATLDDATIGEGRRRAVEWAQARN
ncbi:tetratricopeptide repeat protein [Thioalkalivibrio sulfidiphilus]|uniref:tetratricopeptide repeat protein n=1 Tax=Thioalkalivibrio sulfidiphilus TaxID=1033854 RepID=UPI003B2FACF5